MNRSTPPIAGATLWGNGETFLHISARDSECLVCGSRSEYVVLRYRDPNEYSTHPLCADHSGWRKGKGYSRW